jgi:hypothetical protein
VHHQVLGRLALHPFGFLLLSSFHYQTENEEQTSGFLCYQHYLLFFSGAEDLVSIKKETLRFKLEFLSVSAHEILNESSENLGNPIFPQILSFKVSVLLQNFTLNMKTGHLLLILIFVFPPQ